MSTAADASSRTEFVYRDAHGIQISAYEWAGNADPVAAVQISHGVGEHAKRYDDFARHLVGLGFIVYADDHRGHGETWRVQYSGDTSRLGRLGPGGLRAADAAILQLTGIIRERHPGLPVILFAHSWGSLMAQRALNDHPRTWDAVVLSGSAFRTSRFMASGNFNRAWAGEAANGFEWLSRDDAQVAAYIADPLCFGADVLKLFGVSDALRLYGKPSSGLDGGVSILIASGTDDPLSRGDGLQRLAEEYRRRGVQDVTLKLFEGARHEILNEVNRDEVYASISTWMLEKVSEN